MDLRLKINFKIRLIGWLKRKIFQIIKFQPHQWTSIYREERPIKDGIEIGRTYSLAFPIKILDPRSNNYKQFIFSERKFFNLNHVLIEPFQGLIWADSKNRELFKESTRWHPYVLQTSFPLKPPRLKKISIKEGVILTSTPYWHWLIEDLPITIGILQNKIKDIPIIVSSKRPPYVDDFLAYTNNQIIEIGEIVKVDNLYTIDKGDNSGWPHPDDVKILKNYEPFAKNINNSNDRKIYVSRKYSKRSPKNENEIENIFLDRGYEIHYFERLNLNEQIILSSSAKIIAGIHGAGLSNMIWMSAGGKILDIYNENYWTESFHRCAHICELEYLYFGYKGKTTQNIDILALKNYLEKNNL